MVLEYFFSSKEVNAGFVGEGVIFGGFARLFSLVVTGTGLASGIVAYLLFRAAARRPGRPVVYGDDARE